jgi:hypothetical protein
MSTRTCVERKFKKHRGGAVQLAQSKDPSKGEFFKHYLRRELTGARYN